MINKRKLHHLYTKTKFISTKLLLVLFIVSLIVTLFSLRQNNLNVIELRNKVLKADEDGGKVEAALKNLRKYTYSHMNTNLNSGSTAIQHPIQLKYTYDRLVAAEKERVSKVNERIYAEAQAVCEQRFPIGLSGSGRIPCIEEYVAQNGAKEQPIQDSLYKYSFVSPIWTADFAGISLAITLLLLIILIAKVLTDRWLKKQFHEHM